MSRHDEGNAVTEDQGTPASHVAATAAVIDPDPVLVRVCPKCSVQSQTAGEYCPHCGAPFVSRARRLSKKLVLAVVAVLVLGGAATGVTLKVRHDHATHAKAVAAAAAKKKATAAREAAADAAAAA